MLFWHLLLSLPVLLPLSSIQSVVSKPFQPFGLSQSSTAFRTLVNEGRSKGESSFTSLLNGQTCYKSHHEATAAMVRRTVPSFKGYQLLQRRQQSAIVGTVSGIAALKGFWQRISMKALYNNALGEQPKHLFTITEGILQATFSCLGQEVPWDFVQDFSMKLVGMVDMGWTDTFDAVYEQEDTGYVFWVSLRVLIKATKKKSPVVGGRSNHL